MKRNFGSPGRLDLSAIDRAPAAAFIDGKARALAGFLAVGVSLLGVALLGLALYQIGAHVALAVLAHPSALGGR